MAEEEKNEIRGAFVESLERNNKAIKSARAEAIFEDAEMAYKRKVENLDRDLKRLKRDRENMLDLSPTNSHSLMLADNFDDCKFVEDDLSLSIGIRETEIKLEIAQKRYEYLFGGK